jgi:hypothetical protein
MPARAFTAPRGAFDKMSLPAGGQASDLLRVSEVVDRPSLPAACCNGPARCRRVRGRGCPRRIDPAGTNKRAARPAHLTVPNRSSDNAFDTDCITAAGSGRDKTATTTELSFGNCMHGARPHNGAKLLSAVPLYCVFSSVYVVTCWWMRSLSVTSMVLPSLAAARRISSLTLP